MTASRKKFPVNSLRGRLTLYYTAFFTLALLILETVTYITVNNVAYRAAKGEARIAANLIANDYTASHQSLAVYFADNPLSSLLTTPDTRSVNTPGLLVQVNDRDDHVITNSLNLGEDTLHPPPAAIRAVLDGTAMGVVQEISSGRIINYLHPLRQNDRIIGYVQVASFLGDTDRALNGLFLAFSIGGLLTIVLAAIGGLVVAQAALRPLRAIISTSRAITGAQDLDQRVLVPDQTDDLRVLATTINDLFGRLEAAFSREQQFVADVSHELRTPLAAMRGNLEVLQRITNDKGSLLSETLVDMRAEVARMIRLVNNLLVLAQADAGVRLQLADTELDTLLLEVYREWKQLAEHVKLQIEIDDQIRLRIDRDRIKQAILNLVANALAHTPPGGSITLRLTQRGSHAVIEVSDTGSGIPQEALPHLFDRFFRADPARSGGRGGAGLGLSIALQIAEAHGGTILIDSAVGMGSSFRLSLPLSLEIDTYPLMTIAQSGESQLT